MQRGGANAVEALRRRLAPQRLQRKVRRARALKDALGADQTAYQLVMEAIGKPPNGAAMGEAAGRLPWTDLRALGTTAEEAAARLAEAVGRRPWRAVRGASGSAAGAAGAVAALPPGAARERLRIPGLVGPARVDQLLADGVYPFRLARGPVEAVSERWLGLPARVSIARARCGGGWSAMG